MFEQKKLQRSEIKQDYSKDLKSLTGEELNSVVNSFRRFKAIQLEKIRKSNPNFGLEAQAHKFDREAVVNLMQRIIFRKASKKDVLEESYGEAAVIIDWYLAGQKGQEKKQTQEKLRTEEAKAS